MAKDQVYTFKNPKGLARAASFALGAHALAVGVMAVATALIPNAAQASDLSPMTFIFGLASLLYLLSLPPYAILFLMWVYRANRNAHSFSGGMEVGPGWNVGWFFIPIASLWKPFQGLDETWRVSHAPNHWMVTPTSPLLRVWWGAYLSAGVVGGLGNLLQSSESSNEASFSTLLTSLGLVVAAVASGLAIVVVRRVTAAQIRVFETEVFN